MDGHQALEYVRSRHGDAIGDFGRSTRQQQVLVQVQHKINAMSVLTNLPVLVDELQNYVRTDLTLRQLYDLDQISHHIHAADITKVVLSVPTYGQYAFSKDGQSIVEPNWARIDPVVRQMFAPIKLSTTAPSLRAPSPRPGPLPAVSCPRASPATCSMCRTETSTSSPRPGR
jgi:anionic cell wall polymer biosynthesis LytR-Cps2A-Psr (LCP) family protein